VCWGVLAAQNTELPQALIMQRGKIFHTKAIAGRGYFKIINRTGCFIFAANYNF
jgi:hypothetical protein